MNGFRGIDNVDNLMSRIKMEREVRKVNLIKETPKDKSEGIALICKALNSIKEFEDAVREVTEGYKGELLSFIEEDIMEMDRSEFEFFRDVMVEDKGFLDAPILRSTVPLKIMDRKSREVDPSLEQEIIDFYRKF